MTVADNQPTLDLDLDPVEATAVRTGLSPDTIRLLLEYAGGDDGRKH